MCEKCGRCCLNTEMILFKSDIDLIIKTHPKELNIEEICHTNENGLYQLNNIDGHCIFFEISSKSCKIYDYRPKGCRFYPLVYNLSKNKCILDEECPRPNLFYQDDDVFKNSCKELKEYLSNNKIF